MKYLYIIGLGIVVYFLFISGGSGSMVDYSRVKANENVLNNGEFNQSMTSWSVYTGSASVLNGTATFNAMTTGGFPHFGQSFSPISIGSHIVCEAKVKSKGSKTGIVNNNKGCGIGIDYRANPNVCEISFTLNGPATDSTEWTLIGLDYTMPSHGWDYTAMPIGSYYSINAETGLPVPSLTYQGSNWGRRDNSDNGCAATSTPPTFYWTNRFPEGGKNVVWVHDWFNTELGCDVDYIRCKVN